MAMMNFIPNPSGLPLVAAEVRYAISVPVRVAPQQGAR
jgi:hypothetical protein